MTTRLIHSLFLALAQGVDRLPPGDVVFTAFSLHCTDRDGYNDKAPCRFQVFPALPQGMILLTILFFQLSRS
jgi:hypothetical protein